MEALPFDVAISFLSGDEPLALKIQSELSENLAVFVYSKRQEELAGTDGLEAFRQTFLSQSRLVVVLYRDGWGKTRWTAVEELAIKDRMFNGGWKTLLFVMLDDQSTPPTWLPETNIRLNHALYGDALVGAIKMRAQELGSVLRAETALERAKRSQTTELARAERERQLSKQGSTAVRKQHELLGSLLNEKIAEIQPHLTAMKLEYGSDAREYVIRTERVSLNFYLYTTFPVTESRIVVKEFDGALILPGDRPHRRHFPGDEPRAIAKHEFYFDYHSARGWCWRPEKSTKDLLTTSELGEHLIKRVLELQEKLRDQPRVYNRGHRDDDEYSPWA